MHRRALRTLATATAITLGALGAGSAHAAGPERVSDSYTDTFFDDFIFELCGIETYTTVTERWTLKTFADGSQSFHINRVFVPEDPRIPIEMGAGTGFYAPDGSSVRVGSLTRLFAQDGGEPRLLLIDGGWAAFDANEDPHERHGHVVSPFVEDLSPYYCPQSGAD